MYSEWVGLLFLAVFIWLGVLSFWLFKQRDLFKSLFPKSGERDIRKKFEEVIKVVSQFEEDLKKINHKLTEVEELGLSHIQRVQLNRYNPYDDTGGDQSFTLSLLDSKGNGVVVSSLHARSGTRVFAKPVVLGRASKYQFSEEEALVVEKTMHEKT